MEDRSVEFPQRYQLKKVEGTDDIYDFIPVPGKIISEGTLINKKALLQDATAALFNLSGDTALPDKVFEILSKAALVGDDGGLVTPDGEPVEIPDLIMGEYTGTGKYGSSNRTSVSLPKEPNLFIVCEKNQITTFIGLFIMGTGYMPVFKINNGFVTYASSAVTSFSGQSLSWYTTETGGGPDASAADWQLNLKGVKYGYVALF